jgi:hypothetical protein
MAQPTSPRLCATRARHVIYYDDIVLAYCAFCWY